MSLAVLMASMLAIACLTVSSHFVDSRTVVPTDTVGPGTNVLPSTERVGRISGLHPDVLENNVFSYPGLLWQQK